MVPHQRPLGSPLPASPRLTLDSVNEIFSFLYYRNFVIIFVARMIIGISHHNIYTNHYCNNDYESVMSHGLYHLYCKEITDKKALDFVIRTVWAYVTDYLGVLVYVKGGRS